MNVVKFHNAEHFKCNDLRRWKIEIGKWFSIRLHHWVEGDPEEYRPVDRVRAPTTRYRTKDWRHAVVNCLPGTWTVVITGRVVDKWRFWIGSRKVDTNEWNGRICDS